MEKLHKLAPEIVTECDDEMDTSDLEGDESDLEAFDNDFEAVESDVKVHFIDTIDDGYVSDDAASQNVEPDMDNESPLPVVEDEEIFEDDSESSPIPNDDDAAGTTGSNILKSAIGLLKDWSKKVGRNDWSSISKNDVNEILDKFKAFDVKKVVPEHAADQFSSLTKLLRVRKRPQMRFCVAILFCDLSK